ncbi:hypothetical protein SAMN04488168_110143 [Bacillus sp. 491mf]|uniref:hypothetical protein n=1 Tax=Bacillus sp. 491mf TaxID=1761755 RepID=UPI0008E24865|nr:hypothetical protein [Bacillus sp. 491mf]SFC85229.1 hypothetical protein SAMN04488168_110143 [Bacillus sp. 491mf]
MKKLFDQVYAFNLEVNGPYTDLAAGYEVLKIYMAENNLTQNGHVMEIYEKGLIPTNLDLQDLRPNLSRNPSDFLTKICAPII